MVRTHINWFGISSSLSFIHMITYTSTKSLLWDEITYTHIWISGGSLLKWTGLCEITGKRSLTDSVWPLLNCSEDYITLEWDKRLHTRRMGGRHQTRLRPDCAKSNPAEGSGDFPQARCHFVLNNTYETSNISSTSATWFVPFLLFYVCVCVFVFLRKVLSCFRT